MNSVLKQIFTENVESIIWKNKFAPSTLSIAAGKNVSEIEVFEIILRSPLSDDTLFRAIDRSVHYHIVFLVRYENQCQLRVGFKEESINTSTFKVTTYYHTDWTNENSLSLSIIGLDMDAVYDNFVRQIGSSRLGDSPTSESLKSSVERDEQRKKLQKQIDTLERKARKEKQLNLVKEIDDEIRECKRKLLGL